eukprot:scaffold2090_cov225-Prasinococcus_capsulatus_cf.AAC.40
MDKPGRAREKPKCSNYGYKAAGVVFVVLGALTIGLATGVGARPLGDSIDYEALFQVRQAAATTIATTLHVPSVLLQPTDQRTSLLPPTIRNGGSTTIGLTKERSSPAALASSNPMPCT